MHPFYRECVGIRGGGCLFFIFHNNFTKYVHSHIKQSLSHTHIHYDTGFSPLHHNYWILSLHDDAFTINTQSVLK